nr:hypothetical protein TgIa.2110c [Toxoplasma gondii RH]
MGLFQKRRKHGLSCQKQSRAAAGSTECSHPPYGGPHLPHPTRPPPHGGQIPVGSRAPSNDKCAQFVHTASVRPTTLKGHGSSPSRGCGSSPRPRSSIPRGHDYNSRPHSGNAIFPFHDFGKRPPPSAQQTYWASPPDPRLQQIGSNGMRSLGSDRHLSSYRCGKSSGHASRSHQKYGDRRQLDQQTNQVNNSSAPSPTGSSWARSPMPSSTKRNSSLQAPSYARGRPESPVSFARSVEKRSNAPRHSYPSRGSARLHSQVPLRKLSNHTHHVTAPPTRKRYSDSNNFPVLVTPMEQRDDSNARPESTPDDGVATIPSWRRFTDCCEAGSFDSGPSYADDQERNQMHLHIYQPLKPTVFSESNPQPAHSALATQQYFNIFVPPAVERYMPGGLAGSDTVLASRAFQQTDYDSLVNALVQENIYYQQLLAEQQEQLYATASYQAIHCSPFWSGPEHNWQSGSTYGNYFYSPGAFWQVDQQDFFQNEEWAY